MSARAALRSPDCYQPARSFDEALHIMRANVAAAGRERLPLEQSAGRFLAEPVIASRASPARPLSAMDGFAIADEHEHLFRVVRTVYADAACPPMLARDEAVRVMTGAPVPGNAVRVVPCEAARADGAQVTLAFAAGDKTNIRRTGSDFAAGVTLLPVGSRLDAPALVGAAAADVATVAVGRRPRIAILACGDELRAPGRGGSAEATIPDSLTLALATMVHAQGGECVECKRLPDRLDSIAAAIEDALAHADCIVIAGGASRGEKDYARQALAILGHTPVFAGLNIRPGKPVWYAAAGSKHVLGLPGNPTAAITTARLLLHPLLAWLAGGNCDPGDEWILAPLAHDLAANGPRETFLLAAVREGKLVIEPRQQASGQKSLALCPYLARRPAHAPALPASSLVPVLRF